MAEQGVQSTRPSFMVWPRDEPAIAKSESEGAAMTEAVTYVTQSRFFTPAFNAAIFDGPIRIYFAQYQEAQALKLYFNLQERFGEIRRQARGIFKERGRNIFVLLYPNEETFDLSFSGEAAEDAILAPTAIAREKLGTDIVFGVRGPVEDEVYETLFEQMDAVVRA